MKNSKIYTFIYYISILFVTIYLFNSDLFSFTKICINLNLFISIFFLTAGFIIYPQVLNQILNYQGIKSDYKSCFSALSKTIFSKYIPGKVAMIYAIAYNLKKNEEVSLSRLSYNVMLFQIFSIISGLILGLSFVFQIDNIHPFWKYGSLLIIVIVIFILNSKYFFNYITKFISKRTGKQLEIPHFTLHSIVFIISLSLLFWACWGIGIYFLINSLGINISGQLLIIFLFPFSISLGILSVIAPGGIGIREGILAGFIVYLGNSVSTAAEVSIISRIWFILGEIIFFSISIIIPFFYSQYTKRFKQ